MIITMRSPRGDAPLDIPRQDDGSLYPYEMIYDGAGRRAYADNLADLVGALIPGYPAMMSPVQQAEARTALCTRAQVTLQAFINADTHLDGCDEQQRAVLTAPRHEPPVVATWTAPVPLVLVTVFYRPTGPLPVPAAAEAGQLIWLDPGDDTTLLLSLHAAGLIQVAVADEEGEQ